MPVAPANPGARPRPILALGDLSPLADAIASCETLADLAMAATRFYTFSPLLAHAIALHKHGRTGLFGDAIAWACAAAGGTLRGDQWLRVLIELLQYPRATAQGASVATAIDAAIELGLLREVPRLGGFTATRKVKAELFGDRYAAAWA